MRRPRWRALRSPCLHLLCCCQIFGCATILLATKVEECPRSVRDVALASFEYRIKVAKKADVAGLKQSLANQVCYACALHD